MARPGLTGLLLVGGASTRFGSPKALARFGGETLAERGWRTLGEACAHRLAVGKRSEALGLPFPVIDDGSDVKAPIMGLIAGLEAAGDQVRRAFANRALLAGLQRADELLDFRPELVMRTQLEQEVVPRRSRNAATEARVQLLDGTSSTVETTPDALEIVQRLDGTVSLRRLVGRASPSARREVLHLCRELAELGAVNLRR